MKKRTPVRIHYPSALKTALWGHSGLRAIAAIPLCRERARMRGSASWLRPPHQTCLPPSTGAARINPESHRMETPIPRNAGPNPVRNAESLRTSRIEALRREIDELGAQKAAKEQEIRHLKAAPSSLLDKITHESGHSVLEAPPCPELASPRGFEP
jgi:hypothetical protein